MVLTGLNGVEWDAVELPSQFMENWCYHPATLKGMSSHIISKQPLPDDLINKMIASRTFLSGLAVVRQLQFGMVDMQLHSMPFEKDAPAASVAALVFETARSIAQQASVLPPLPEDRMLCSFSHIFAGGYSAGYYSYMYSQGMMLLCGSV